jgi:hypothetical protein
MPTLPVNPVNGYGRLFGWLVADVLVGIRLSVCLAERAEAVRFSGGRGGKAFGAGNDFPRRSCGGLNVFAEIAA